MKAVVLAHPIAAFVTAAIGILSLATVLLVGLPYFQLYGIEPEPGAAPPTVRQSRGRASYVSLGCVYCHTQQPRDPSYAPDGERGWGRPSTPGDYAYEYPHQLGTMRTGPDLFNVGARLNDRGWHLTHLYNPRSVADWSIMPAFPFLFDVVEEPAADDVVVNVPEAYAPDGGVVVAKQEALDLVDYLLALDHTYPSAYLPPPAKEER